MLSAKTQYALLAMLQLAHDFAAGESVQVRKIAARHGIPANFLVQILHELKRVGLATSSRGASGGYRLSRPPEEISLADVVDAFDAVDEHARCQAAQSPLASLVAGLCGDLAQARRDVLSSTTLADLADRAAVGAGPMWYI